MGHGRGRFGRRLAEGKPVNSPTRDNRAYRVWRGRGGRRAPAVAVAEPSSLESPAGTASRLQKCPGSP